MKKFMTFLKKQKRTVFEIADAVFVAVYDDVHFSTDLKQALEKAAKKYKVKSINHILYVDTSPVPPEEMLELPRGIHATAAVLGPYSFFPTLSSILEVCADAYDFLVCGTKTGEQRVVLFVSATNSRDPKNVGVLALLASAYLCYARLYRNGIEGLGTFRERCVAARAASELQLEDTYSPTVSNYLQNVTLLLQHKALPSKFPLHSLKVIVTGNVSLAEGQRWNPVMRVYQGAIASDCYTTIYPKDNGLGKDSTIGAGYAMFDMNAAVAGDLLFVFEHWDMREKSCQPLFSFARHTAYVSPPAIRVGTDEIDFLAGNQTLTFDQDFSIDFYVDEIRPPSARKPTSSSSPSSSSVVSLTSNTRNVPIPKGASYLSVTSLVSDGETSAVSKEDYEFYKKMFDKETALNVEQVIRGYEVVEDLVVNAPSEAPRLLSEVTPELPVPGNRMDGANFVKELHERFAATGQKEKADPRKRSEVVADLFQTEDPEVIEELVTFVNRFKEETGSGGSGLRDKQGVKTLREVIQKTFLIHRPGSDGDGEAFEGDDGFGDIAHYVDEEEVLQGDIDSILRERPPYRESEDEKTGSETGSETEVDTDYDSEQSLQSTVSDLEDSDERGSPQKRQRRRRSRARSERIESDGSQTDDAASERELLSRAVRQILSNVKTSGATDRFRPRDFLKAAPTNDDAENVLVDQVTEALKTLVRESAQKNDGRGKKFVSAQELIDKVNVLRHEAHRSTPVINGAPPPPLPPPLGLRPPVPPPGGPDGKPGPPAPPPPPPPMGLRAPVPPPGGPDGKPGPPPPPPPPPPMGLRAPIPPPGGLDGKPGPPPPPPPPPPLPRHVNDSKPPSGPPLPPPPPPPVGKLRDPRKIPAGPPPPATGLATSGAQRPVKKKPNQTKRLNWNLISNMKVGQTLYAREEFRQLPMNTLSDDITKDILEKFSNRPSVNLARQSEEKQSNKPVDIVSAGILEHKRMQNIEIMLRKFNAEPQDIACAVSTLDPRSITLTDENIDVLITNAFKDEEIILAKQYSGTDGQINSLNKAEALAYHVARVPRFLAKLTAMLTMRSSGQIHMELKTVIGNVLKACAEVRNSERFHGVLASVLAIGNFLNAGTAKGEAQGFKLSGLLRLSETHARDREISLLHYLAGVIEAKAPDLLGFPADLSHVAFARRNAKEDIAREVHAFERAVQALKREVQNIKKEHKSSPSKDPVVESCPPAPLPISAEDSQQVEPPGSTASNDVKFVPKSVDIGENCSDSTRQERGRGAIRGNDSFSDLEVAEQKLSQAQIFAAELTKMHEEMEKEFSELALLLGEDARHAKTEELFSTLNTFMIDFANCVRDNRNRKAEQLRKERIAKRELEESKKREQRESSKDVNNVRDAKPAPQENGSGPQHLASDSTQRTPIDAQ